MNITVFNEKEGTTSKISFEKTTVADLLEQLYINSETVLVVRNNEVITQDIQLSDKDKLDILSVVSGG